MSRKRSATSQDAIEANTGRRAIQGRAEDLKRTKDNCSELPSLIAPTEAWSVDISILRALANGMPNYDASKSIFVLCLQGELNIHYHLLQSILQTLHIHSPTLVAFHLTHLEPVNHPRPLSSDIATLQITPEQNMFVQLGLLNPQGGGRQPLDALILLDSHGRRRLILPFGWGAGRHVLQVAGGRGVQERLIDVLVKAVKLAETEGPISTAS